MKKIFMLMGAWTFLLSYSSVAGMYENESIDGNEGTSDNATEDYKDAEVNYSEDEMQLLNDLVSLNDTLKNKKVAPATENQEVNANTKAENSSENDIIQSIKEAEEQKTEGIKKTVEKWLKAHNISSINDKVAKNQKTCLHYAAANDLEEVVEALLKLKAEVNSKDQFDNTSLYYALMEGNSIKIVYLLVEAGADLEENMVKKITCVFLRNMQTYVLPRANYNTSFYYGCPHNKKHHNLFLQPFKESYRHYQALILVEMYQRQLLSAKEKRICNYVFDNLPHYKSNDEEAIRQWIMIVNWLFNFFHFEQRLPVMYGVL